MPYQDSVCIFARAHEEIGRPSGAQPGAKRNKPEGIPGDTMSKPRIRPFPVSSLRSYSKSEIALSSLMEPRAWLPLLGRATSKLTKSFGLGSASLSTLRVQSVSQRRLRVDFPGRWLFAAFLNPEDSRRGFLALDPLLVDRLLERLGKAADPLPAVKSLEPGDHGRLAWTIASCLLDLSQEDERFDSWRYMGLLESTGAVGRFCSSDDVFVACWISVEVGWEEGWAVWLEPEQSLHNRLTQSPRDSQSQVSAWLADVPVAVRKIVGWSELRAGEISALRPGDVIVLSKPIPAGQVLLKAGSVVLLAKENTDGLCVTQVQKVQGGDAMLEGDLISQGNNSGEVLEFSSAADLPVTITAEAGRVDLTVAQMAGLRAGDVLTLPQTLMGPIELRAGDRLFARGELVDVEGMRGVRLAQVGPCSGRGDEQAA